MPEQSGVLQSAVGLPDQNDQPSQSPVNGKRRQSENLSPDSKRPRLSTGAIDSTILDKTARRQQNDEAERKRGKRLFGGLLGALSQKPSSSLQKRRIDIEQKQQEKLKLQAQENDHVKQQRLIDLNALRHREQVEFEKQSVHIQQSNTLATANFLQTKTEPHLYYMPWELLPAEKETIQSQLAKARSDVDEKPKHPQIAFDSESSGIQLQGGDDDDGAQLPVPEDTVGDSTNATEHDVLEPQIEHTNTKVEGSNANRGGVDVVSKANMDDAVEEMGGEGEEDTVVY